MEPVCRVVVGAVLLHYLTPCGPVTSWPLADYIALLLKRIEHRHFTANFSDIHPSTDNDDRQQCFKPPPAHGPISCTPRKALDERR